jgi:cysteinyl-tRNA synthetase
LHERRPIGTGGEVFRRERPFPDMGLRLYNTRTRTVEPFAPLDGRRVRMYVCGLTPSAEAHLGHARSFLFFDILRRYLTYRAYDVTYVRNVTDVDDRSIAAGKATGVPWSQIVQGYLDSFERSMERLGVDPPDEEPRATGYIPQILDMIGELIERGHAYVVEDGVYYRVKSFARYGQLANRNTDELLSGARIAVDEHKEDALDFALWKFAKPDEPAWDSRWGAGRPGWHIECSAMSRALLGEPFDIHGGGVDLIFPHHENEIAQSEALMPAPPMANFWLHGGLLNFDGKKMSKSLGNFEPLSALLDRHDPLAIRLLFLQTGYRKAMNFTEDAIAGATVALEKLRKAYHTLGEAPGATEVAPLKAKLFAALDEDINTSGALGVLFEIAAAKFVDDASEARALFRDALGIFGIDAVLDREEPAAALPALDADTAARIDGLIAARNAARKERDFARADALRAELAAMRVALTDAPDGTTSWALV